SATADLDNTTEFQCFKPKSWTPFSWRVAVYDIFHARLVDDSTGNVLQAYHLGDENCLSSSNCPRYESVTCTSDSPGFADANYPPSSVVSALGTKAVMSQLGVKAAIERCGASN